MSYEWTYPWTDEQISPWSKWVLEAKVTPTQIKGTHFREIQQHINEWRNTHGMSPVNWGDFVEITDLIKDMSSEEATLIRLSQLNFLQKRLEEMMLFLNLGFDYIYGHYAFADFLEASTPSLAGDELRNGDFFPDDDWESEHIWYPEDEYITRIKRVNILEMRAILELLNEDELYTQVKGSHTTWCDGCKYGSVNNTTYHPTEISWSGTFLKPKKYKISKIEVGLVTTAKISNFTWGQNSFSLSIEPNGVEHDTLWFNSPIIKMTMIDGKIYFCNDFYFSYYYYEDGYPDHHWSDCEYVCTPDITCCLCAYRCNTVYRWHSPYEISSTRIISVAGRSIGHYEIGTGRFHQGTCDVAKYGCEYTEGWAIPWVNYVGWTGGGSCEGEPAFVGCDWGNRVVELSPEATLSVSYSAWARNKAKKSGVILVDYTYVVN